MSDCGKFVASQRWREREDNFESMVARDDARCLDHRVEQVANLSAAAAGQNRDQSGVRRKSVTLQRKSVTLQRFRATRRGRDAIEQRMPDE